MANRILLAGASGVIGRALVPQLLAAGHRVVGTARSEAGRGAIKALGIEAVAMDVFDAARVHEVLRSAAPEVVIHQLTDLSGGSATSSEDVVRRNAQLRREGTANLVSAASAIGVQRVVAQSIAWAYAPKDGPFGEADPLDVDATGTRSISVNDGIVPLERAVLSDDNFEGLVLRYGQLYGAGTWSSTPSGPMPLHVEAAAYAAFLAIDHGRPGPYNIAEPGGAISIERAVRELGWRADFRLP